MFKGFDAESASHDRTVTTRSPIQVPEIHFIFSKNPFFSFQLNGILFFSPFVPVLPLESVCSIFLIYHVGVRPRVVFAFSLCLSG